MLMTMLMSAFGMEGVEYPWGSLGKVGPSKEDISVVTNTLVAKMDEMRSDFLSEISALREEVESLRNDVVQLGRAETIGYDERSVTSFMSLDELNVSNEPRPEIEPLSKNPDVHVVTDGFTAPPPEKKSTKKTKPKEGKKVKKEKVVLPNPYEDLPHDSIAFEVYTSILHYLDENGPLMNNNMKRLGVIPKGAIVTKKAKAGLKKLVADDEKLRFHQVDALRGFYYIEDGRDPQVIYDEEIALS